MSQLDSNAPPPLIVVEVGADNQVSLDVESSDFRVEIVDIDMILIFPDGSRIVLPGVGLQALSGNAPIINFSDRSIDARELLGMLGEVREVGPGACTAQLAEHPTSRWSG